MSAPAGTVPVMTEHSPSLRGEDVLELPKSWKRYLHPRRGGAPGPKIKLAGSTEVELRAPYAGEVEKVLAHGGTDAALAAAAREHLAGTVSPLGAALVAAVPESAFSNGEMTVRFVDAWVRTHGLRFAVHAFLDRCDIVVGPYGAVDSGLTTARTSTWRFDHYRLADAAKRLRAMLAVAPDAEYRAVVDLLAELRTTPGRRLISAYLVPTELEWVAGCCAEAADDDSVWTGLSFVRRHLLLQSLGSPEHFGILGPKARVSVSVCYDIDNLVTLADGVGPAIAPYLAEAFDEFHDEPRRRKNLLEVLGRLPGDEAFRLMLERAGNLHMRTALRAAMQHRPVRALRLLAAAAADGDAVAGELLADHVRAGAELVAQVLPELPPRARAAVEELSAAGRRVPEASADELPRLLVDPPWVRTGRKPRPAVLKGLPVPEGQTVAWAPGERHAWLQTDIANPEGDHVTLAPVPPPAQRDRTWERRIANIRDGVAVEPAGRELYWQAGMLARGPEELVRPVLREWAPDWRKQRGLGNDGPWSPGNWLRTLLARFELDALPVALDYARARPAHGCELLLPFLDGEVANTMAHWLLNVATARETAVRWFARHGSAALRHLLPVALGKPGPARSAAEYALHFLADQEGEDTVLDAARGYGEQPVALVEDLLSSDPERLRPRKKVPTRLGVDADVLPQVLLRGRERALPAPAVRHLLTLLAISSPDDADDDLAAVLEACDDDSLAEFGWALFHQWREHGASPQHAWQFAALGRLGDDETARRLVPLILAWPGEDGHRLAVRGLDVLVRIGGDCAVRSLHQIARTATFKALKKRARETFEEIVRARGLTPEQLRTLLAPDSE